MLNQLTTVALPFAKVSKEEVLHPEAGTDTAFGSLVTLTMP